MKNSIFKYIFIIGFIIFLIVIYALFYNKEEIKQNVDQTSTKSNIITNIRIGVAGFDSMNPIISNNKNIKEISRLIFDSLITINSNGKLEYELASEIAKTDALTYVIKLRENILWHDGTPLTAADVRFTIDKIKNNNTKYSENLKYVYMVEDIDTSTLKITLSQEVEFFEYKLTFPILSETYFQNEDFVNTAKNITIIGTGKFYIAEASGNKIKLLKSENYWNKENKNTMLTEIDITLYSTIGEVYTAFKSGYLDFVNVEVSNVEEYIGNLGYNRNEYYSRDINFLSFNTTRNEMLADNRVRKAINYMLDRNNIISNIGSGYAVSQFFFSPNNWLYDSKLEVSYSAEEAKRLLEEAGYVYTNNTWVKDGKVLEFSIIVNANRTDRVLAVQNIANQLGNHGIRVSVNGVSGDSYYNYLNTKNYEVILCGMETDFTPRLSTLFGAGNIANYNNDQINQILDIVKGSLDNNSLLENYKQLYDIYLNDMPYLFLYRETDMMVYNQTLCGTLTPTSFSIFHNVEKWYRK